MYWENLVFDAEQPHASGRFWEALLGGEQLTDNAGGYETRLRRASTQYLDLCFPKVEEPSAPSQRVHPVLGDGTYNATAHVQVRRDPFGREYLVRGPVAGARHALEAVRIASANPAHDAKFWQQLTGWKHAAGQPSTLEDPRGPGPVLMLVEEEASKTTQKNTIHLDLRLEPGDDIASIAATIQALGGTEMHPDWGELPWRVFQDPSGNEFCILPDPAATA